MTGAPGAARAFAPGFSLIELLVVIAVIAIIAAIALPNLLSARIQANESAAIETMRVVASAQAQCQSSVAIDNNSNGRGEHAFGAEMGGVAGLRTPTGVPGAVMFRPRLLSWSAEDVASLAGGTFGTGGAMRRSGYMFAIFLPSATADFVPEAPSGGASPAHNPDASMSEVLWCAYAWPSVANTSGRKVFFVNQHGDVLGASNVPTRYSGTTNGPNPNAAFLGSIVGVDMASSVAANATGQDGQRWFVVY